MTKPAKVFGLDENRVWKANKMYGDTYMLADLGENETPEPPDSVAIKLPRELVRQIGRYKREGETLKVAAERLILESIATQKAASEMDQAVEQINKLNKNPSRMPVMIPIYFPTAQLQKLYKVSLCYPYETYQDIVFQVVQEFIKKWEV